MATALPAPVPTGHDVTAHHLTFLERRLPSEATTNGRGRLDKYKRFFGAFFFYIAGRVRVDWVSGLAHTGVRFCGFFESKYVYFTK